MIIIFIIFIIGLILCPQFYNHSHEKDHYLFIAHQFESMGATS